MGTRSGPRSRLTLADTRPVARIEVAIVVIPCGSSSFGADAPSQRMWLLGGVARPSACFVSLVRVTRLEHGALDPLHLILDMTMRT